VAYRWLRAEIIHLRLAPGSALGEAQLSERIGVSRTPVREALALLKGEGLVVDTGSRTLRVAPMTSREVRALFELREALETQAARLAASRRDPGQFAALRADMMAGPADQHDDSEKAELYHLSSRLDQTILEAADNPHIEAALRAISGLLARLRRAARSNPERLAQATAEHVVIIDAIIDGDEMLASQATAYHLRRSLDNLLATLPLD
jgi:DNA-binding GntR family transcriptional regulator